MLIGRTLKERYRIYDTIGEGGAGKVYLARDSETGQMAVVKVVHSHLVNDEFMARFEREIDLLQRISNPYVIRIYDWALHDEDPETGHLLSYIVTEFVEGLTLADIIDREGKIAEKDALAIARQVALGLADIHEKGIIHRDIKAQNIMITPDQEAKLIDFGIAKGADQATLTGRGTFTGTLHYAPPEQIMEAQSVDHRADIYALGVVLYEMLTARLPVSGEFGTVATKILAGDLEPIRGVSLPVEELVTDMLAYNAADRPASAQVVIQEIEEIIGENPAPPVTTVMGRKIDIDELGSNQLTAHIKTSTGMSIPLTQAETVIGRSAPNDPNVPDIDLWSLGLPEARTASRRHCRIALNNDAYFLEDLDSLNGTRLNSYPLDAGKNYPLHDGDVIMAGRVELVFRANSSQ